MTGIIHAGDSVAGADSFWGVFFCWVLGLVGVDFTGFLGLAGEDCGVKVELFCLRVRAVRLVPAGRALSRYL